VLTHQKDHPPGDHPTTDAAPLLVEALFNACAIHQAECGAAVSVPECGVWHHEAADDWEGRQMYWDWRRRE
jgi:hypothetical protein